MNRRLMQRVVLAIAFLALSVNIVWLPLINGGDDPGSMKIAQIATFVSAIFILASGFKGFSRLLYMIGFVVVAAGLSTALSLDLDASVPMLIRWVWLLAASILVLHLSSTSKGQNSVFGLLLVAAAVQAGWGFFVWWGGGFAADFQSGTFYAPNQYAGYLLLLAPLFLAPALLKRERRAATAWGIFAVFLYLAVLLSGSRAGAVAAFIGIVATLAICARREPRGVKRFAFLVSGFLILGFLLTSPLLFPDEEIAEGSLSSIELKEGSAAISSRQRLQWNKGALRIARTSPLVGTGLGTYGDMLVQVMNPEWHWSRFAHNDYLQALAEGGLPLALGMTALPALGVLVGIRQRRGEADSFNPGIIGGLIGSSAHLLVDHDWSYPAFAVTFVIIVTLSFSMNRLPKPTARPRWFSLAATVVLIAATIVTVADAISANLMTSNEISAIETAIALKPYASAPRMALARKYEQIGNLSRAVQALEAARETDHLDPDTVWAVAALYARVGDEAAARRAYTHAIAIALDAPIGYQLAASFELDNENPNEAAKILEAGISRLLVKPNRQRLAVAIARLFLLRADAEDMLRGPTIASALALRATSIAPNYPPAWIALADFSCRSGNSVLFTSAVQKADELQLGEKDRILLQTVIQRCYEFQAEVPGSHATRDDTK